MQNANYSNHKKKSKFLKFLYRTLFLILIILLLLQFEHFTLAIERLQNINDTQMNMINDLQSHVHSLEVSNANLQIQNEMMKVKINGIIQHPIIHNEVPQNYSIHNDSHNISKVVTGVGMAATTAITVFTVIKHLFMFSPVLP